MSNEVRVGVAVIIMRQNTILLGERIGAHGANTWATPGGHLEFGEAVEQCAIREVCEETGLNVSKITKLDFTNDIFSAENKHYITLYVKAEYEGGEPTLYEPDKCIQWRWCDINNLPSPLFTSLKNYLATATLTV
ncbi:MULTISPECIES: NUDIX hydrolase [unclassified Pseudoalteromonas]|uniref:nucleotide triphosphate diphosphatase NUDT15 n=1 Tax=unclassified Pseudoalteromonas TaxID=194690 RepID=UPI000730509A|nr:MULTISPECIES: NUDIX hydrolase [unclassified Pseudoalteromonas]KTD99120.1 ADP-ribose pyrophosphatase [Pseudoalteromonas sp. H71]TMN86051.1 NUDIX domain-containing protein [Pseudoalteromonas sp. S410]TMN93376.1 NUDIX domain-containing protein [Pseudoalteromonas sp. S408]TMN99870.1 NUDIX domain-containing protein [Pseudoalteromonas sp. S407]TMO01856.1 NUDIX domain-containing protein [Pseudoalteromonas sp. S409]|tara:strand:- start:3495 stop:3899 length:405 start_codon:yes stop_codon:yes gene_type:complete